MFDKVLNNLLSLFSTSVPLLYPLKTSKNLRFSDVFRGYGSGTLVENELKPIRYNALSTPKSIFFHDSYQKCPIEKEKPSTYFWRYLKREKFWSQLSYQKNYYFCVKGRMVQKLEFSHRKVNQCQINVLFL